jgi:hypothetical protein
MLAELADTSRHWTYVPPGTIADGGDYAIVVPAVASLFKSSTSSVAYCSESVTAQAITYNPSHRLCKRTGSCIKPACWTTKKVQYYSLAYMEKFSGYLVLVLLELTGPTVAAAAAKSTLTGV